jgi:hypothetical protein
MPDLTLANALLEKKYGAGGNAENANAGSKMNFIRETQKPPTAASNSVLPSSVDWKFVAQERLQMLTHFQDEANEWKEAYVKERDRADLFIAQLMGLKSEISENAPPEIKHTVNPLTSHKAKRASWPAYKKQMEALYHDAGMNENIENISQGEDNETKEI